MRATVHQLIPSFSGRDAIGHHTLEVRRVLREAGFASEIFSEVMAPDMRQRGYPWDQYRKARQRADLLVYQASTGSPMVSWLVDRPESLAVNYHNITPPRFFERWEPVAADSMRRARSELRRLAPRAELSIAVSEHNADELEELGFASPVVAPLLLDLDALGQEPDARTLDFLRRSARGGRRWLFVGRVAPHKCQHDVVAAFAAYRRLYDPAAKLAIVGGFSAELYRRSLETMVEELGVAEAVDFTDTISHRELLAHYRAADVFVCLSEHEGFCVPVIEAMHLGVPVVAYASTALPRTVRGAGVLLPGKAPLEVATAVHLVLSDPKRRSALVEAGRARAADFAIEKTAPQMVELIEGFLARRDATGEGGGGG